jgi:hypothetical protein
MITQSRFLKNSEYVKDMDNEPMFHGTVDINGKIYDGKLFRETQYGKEVMVLCLTQDDNEAPF